MPDYDTDDDIHRVQMVYLGPSEYTLPVQLPYAQWGLFAVLACLFAGVTWLIAGGGWAFVAAFVAMPVTALIWKHVNPDRPARKVIGTVLRDWRRTRRPADDDRPLPGLTSRRVRFTDPPPRRALTRTEDRHARP